MCREEEFGNKAPYLEVFKNKTWSPVFYPQQCDRV